MKDKPYQFTEARPSIEVHLPDGRVITGLRGSTLEQFFSALPESERTLIVGAIVNSELRELTYELDMDANVTPIGMESADGARIYRRSLTFLLEVAFERVFPHVELEIDHSVTSGGFFCEVSGRQPLSDTELEKLTADMEVLVKQNLPFLRDRVPLQAAIDYFTKRGESEKVRLLSYRQKDFLVLYSLLGHRDYHHGYMVPSTGYLKWFGLFKMGAGFVLSYPRRFSPTKIQPLPDSPMLLNTFLQYGKWLERLGIDNVAALNDAIAAGRIREVILVSEALHEQRISEIAAQIARNPNNLRIILISGPSSSGKTTFSKRLSVQLISQGLSPYALEMDNYFVEREQTPKDPSGKYDYESMEALDTKLLNFHLQNLIKGEQVQLPRYDFKLGKRFPGEIVKLQLDQLIILEGIHGLNPDLLTSISSSQTYRIYVSALTQLNLDKHNRISTTDTRLLRRIVRDASERGYSALQTLQRWESVRSGEKTHIFPYQEYADTMFNSALAYELSALKPVVEPLLRQVPFGCQEYIEAKRLLTFLEWFLPVDTELIPDNSILREFLGGSILHDFRVWKNGK